MSHKSPKIAELIESRHGHRADAHYLGYFDCFNSQQYFEAHEVLEELWLTDRTGPNGDFHKGLIQLAGAFVHIQKKRPGPAGALFNLAEANLSRFPSEHEHLDVAAVLDLIRTWQEKLARGECDLALTGVDAPRITPFETAFAKPGK